MVPVIPDSAPFTLEQRAWLNGFLAGIFSRGDVNSQAARSIAPTPAQLRPVTILFGSQTGTSEGLAKRAAKDAGKRGFAPTVIDLAELDLARLSSEKNVLLITSTFGDGEPPDNAKALHAALHTAAAGSLAGLRYSVCALGDSNYTAFCKCGKDFDALLERCGASRVAPRADCDLDEEAKFAGWLATALEALGPSANQAQTADALSPSTKGPSESTEARVVSTHTEIACAYSRSNPFPALLLRSVNLSGAGSAKQVHHVEFDLGDSGLAYEAGDALGVMPHNCPELVEEILGLLACDGEEGVPGVDGSTVPLRRALTDLYDLGKPCSELLSRYGGDGSGGAAVAVCHVVDVLAARADVKLAPSEFVRCLKRLQPRLYSISSSPAAHKGHVHLTVGSVHYEAGGRPRKGVCSTFLADRAARHGGRVGIFVHSNRGFRPPASGGTPMIMVGPGTGIAPFRGFLHERRATGATGRNWLFFGDQRSATDFLYRDELLQLKGDGVLTRLELAWSRDQLEKVYVQTRMLEHAAELYAWLEAGAHFYVCGDASRMAKDVDAALHEVIIRAGGKTAEAAAAYVDKLRTTKRYCRDVY